MASKKQLSVEDIDSQIEGLTIHEKITVYKNLGAVIDKQMSDIQSDVASKTNLCSEWDSLKNGKA